ncbi:MAG: hypothetical protein IKL89_04080 [Clostridia bacterium]|nr:hypothetical protein [Clostridia bacterium]
MSQREIDMHAEQALAKFLDDHLYRELLKEEKFASFQRVTSIAQQKQGIDVIAKTGASVAYIDEKAQLHYINKTLPTFAFELEFLLDGRAMEGWFLNDDLKTTHYLLLWPNARTTDLSRISSEDFTQVEGMMISKVKMKRYLNTIGITTPFLKEITRILRQRKLTGPQKTAFDGIKFFVSPSTAYSENPVNMVISKRVLITLTDAHYVVSQDGFRRIPISHQYSEVITDLC